MSDTAPAEPLPGWRAPEIERELPGLLLLQSEAGVGRALPLDGDSPRDVLERLRELSNRFRGARAITLRREPVPSAYRVFFRHIGLDPDVQRTPLEAALLARMVRGGFPSGGLLADVCLIALLDTGVPVWGLDASALEGALGLRLSAPGERLAGGRELPGGRLVVADASAPLAALFEDIEPPLRPRGGCSRVRLFALQVPGVPALYVEEALWSCANALHAP